MTNNAPFLSAFGPTNKTFLEEYFPLVAGRLNFLVSIPLWMTCSFSEGTLASF